MNESQMILSSLAMDLKRMALGLYHGSDQTAKKFSQEALKRTHEAKKLVLPAYIQTIVRSVDKTLSEKSDRTAEDALMYSTIIQNFVLQSL